MRRVIVLVLCSIFHMGGLAVGIWDRAQARGLTRQEWEATYREDAANLRKWDEQLQKAATALIDLATSSSSESATVLSPDEKALGLNYWGQFADIAIGANARADFHRDFVLWLDEERRPDHIRAFLLCDAADLMIHDAGLKVTAAFASNPKWIKLLNEAQPELGLPANSYDQFRDQIHNPERATRQFIAGQYLKALKLLSVFKKVTADPDTNWLLTQAEAYHKTVHSTMLNQGLKFALRQTADVASACAFKAWFPVQKSVANTMGNVKFKRVGMYMSTPQQVREACSKLQPGDIGVSRKNWYLSNAGIPGFWPHAFLHVGTPSQLDLFFDDTDVNSWCAQQSADCTSLTELLKKRYPDAWNKYTSTLTARAAHMKGIHVANPESDELLEPSFIESIAPGVVFRLPEETLAADYLAFLRPKLSKRELAQAILRAFSHSGKPYDYDFDFRTDAQLVCSELVYKSFQGAADFAGLKLPLEQTLGRPLFPPNNIIRKFDEELKSGNAQLDFVAFLDASEADGCCVWGTVEDLRKSWQRPKWDILQK